MSAFDPEDILTRLSLSEKVELLSGVDIWHTKSLPQYGIPSLRLSDGPNGVRGSKLFNGRVRGACFPCGTALASTFNLTLLEKAGRKMGEEAKLKGAHCILGPTINIQRSPLGGRGFESTGEDPVLSGLSGGALVKGIQSTGVLATLKHFVCNDQEHGRNSVQSIVTQRALREIHALPFQLAIQQCAPAAVMAAYNGVNGKFCSENPEILDQLLRKEWKWEGLVMSDWYGTYSTANATIASLDLEMPGPPRFRGQLLKFNVETGKVPMHVLNERVRNMLKFVQKGIESGIPERKEEESADTAETRALLRTIAAESIVLLKNNRDILPLDKSKKTLIIGPNAKLATYHGGGSASLDSYHAATPFEGIRSKLVLPPAYAVGAYSHKLLPLFDTTVRTPTEDRGISMTVYNESPEAPDRNSIDEIIVSKSQFLFADYAHPDLKGPLWYANFECSFVADEDSTWEFGLVVCGTGKLYVNDQLVVDNEAQQVQGESFFGCATREERGCIQVTQGEKYHIRVEFASAPARKLTGPSFPGGILRFGGCKVISDEEAIAEAVKYSKDAEQVILCVGLNADWESEGYDRQTMGLPAHLDELIFAVARANPATTVVNQSGTQITMPWIDEVPVVLQAWYGGNECGNAIADVLFGDTNPSGKLSISFPARLQDNPTYLNFRCEGGRTLYGEDVYVGYRYYESLDRKVLFPFGHGLSYTTFLWSELSIFVDERTDSITLELTVKNTGKLLGSEVIQVYVAPKQKAKVNRPKKELKGFAKIEVEPGYAAKVSVSVGKRLALSYWDEQRSQWCVEKGDYELIASDTSAVKTDKALMGLVKVSETYWWI